MTSPALEAPQVGGVPSWYVKVADSLSDQGAHKNQPINA